MAIRRGVVPIVTASLVRREFSSRVAAWIAEGHDRDCEWIAAGIDWDAWIAGHADDQLGPRCVCAMGGRGG